LSFIPLMILRHIFCIVKTQEQKPQNRNCLTIAIRVLPRLPLFLKHQAECHAFGEETYEDFNIFCSKSAVGAARYSLTALHKPGYMKAPAVTFLRARQAEGLQPRSRHARQGSDLNSPAKDVEHPLLRVQGDSCMQITC